MYILILQGIYNEKTIIYDGYEEAHAEFNKHKAAGIRCHLAKILMSS